MTTPTAISLGATGAWLEPWDCWGWDMLCALVLPGLKSPFSDGCGDFPVGAMLAMAKERLNSPCKHGSNGGSDAIP